MLAALTTQNTSNNTPTTFQWQLSSASGMVKWFPWFSSSTCSRTEPVATSGMDLQQTFLDRSWKNAEFSWLGLNEPTDPNCFWVKGHKK